MAFFNEFPVTRTYDSDLGWLIRHVKENIDNLSSLDSWRALHEAEYKQLKNIVDGLQNHLIDVIVPWNSSVAYQIYTIVEYLGQNYIAIQDVPVGVMITDTNYWTLANTVIAQINAIGNTVSTLQLGMAIVTPQMFGAVGDGITDDTQAFQDAIDYATTNKLSVYLISNYAVTSLTVGQCVICGTNGHTQIIGLDNSAYVFTLTNNGAILREFSINANYGVQFGTWDNRTLSNVCERINVYNCIVGFYHPTAGGYNKMIDCGCTVQEGGTGYIIGAIPADVGSPRTVGTNYVFMIRCTAQASTIWSTTAVGIECNQIEYLWIEDCDIVGFNIGLFTPDTHLNFTNAKIKNTAFFSCRKCFMLQRGAAGSRVFNVIFDGCTFGYCIGEITARQTSWGNISNIDFISCQIAYTGENNISVTTPELTLYYVWINRLDITSRLDVTMTYESNVNATGARFKRYQEAINDIYIAAGGSSTYTYGSTNSLEPIHKPGVILRDPINAFPIYTSSKNADGTWTVTFTNVPVTYSGTIL